MARLSAIGKPGGARAVAAGAGVRHVGAVDVAGDEAGAWRRRHAGRAPTSATASRQCLAIDRLGQELELVGEQIGGA